MTNDCIYIEGAVTTIQAKVASSLTAKGNFTAVKPFEESLRVISDSIKYVQFDENTSFVMTSFLEPI